MATAGAARGAGPERAYASPLPEHGRVVLDADETHHLVRARRVAVGDAVVLFDGRGGSRHARLVAVRGAAAALDVDGPAPDREPARRVVVATAWPDGARADDLVATLAELGVAEVVPIRSARANDDPAPRVERRRERFDRLVREAAKVNGRSRLLVVATACRLDAVLAATVGSRRVLLDTAPGLLPLAAAVGDATTVVLLVGPEGGFTEDEVAMATAAGATPASLGACALRTETAGIAAAALVLGTPPATSG